MTEMKRNQANPTTRPTVKVPFKLGQKVNARSTVATYEAALTKTGMRYVPTMRNGIITYIHPDGLFVNVTNSDYTESYQVSDIRAGWITPNPDGDKKLTYTVSGPVKIREYEPAL